MKKIMIFALLAGSLFANVARADTNKTLVRISCIPEIGLLDIESRDLHDSVAKDLNGKNDRQRALTRAGFYDPHDLSLSCRLGGIDYQIVAEQDPPHNAMCGEDPEVYLTVTRAGQQFVSHVVFGTSCSLMPSITRITVGDGPNSWRGRETQVCYSTEKNGESSASCDWTFGDGTQFEKRFPLDQNRVQRIVSKEEYR